MPEDNVRDAFLLREADQGVGHIFIHQADDLSTEVARHALIFLEAMKCLGVAVPFIVIGARNVDREPVGSEATGDAGANTQKSLGAGPGAEADHDFLRNLRLFQSLSSAVCGFPAAHLLRGGPQGKFAQQIEIADAEKIGQRLFDLFRGVDLALAESVAKLVDGDIDVDHFVGALEEAVGNGFADDGVGGAVDGVVQRFDDAEC